MSAHVGTSPLDGCCLSQLETEGATAVPLSGYPGCRHVASPQPGIALDLSKESALTALSHVSYAPLTRLWELLAGDTLLLVHTGVVWGTPEKAGACTTHARPIKGNSEDAAGHLHCVAQGLRRSHGRMEPRQGTNHASARREPVTEPSWSHSD
jgi:hypothetical protein